MAEAEPSQARKKLRAFLDGIGETVDAKIEPVGNIDKIVVFGIGGSAIQADIVSNCCSEYLDVPFFVNRSPNIPKYIDKNTLSIVSTYSGNTVETLEMFRKVRETQSKIFIISAGGEIQNIAEKEKLPLLKVPTGFEPRYSAGYMIGYIAAIMVQCGFDRFKKQIKECLPQNKQYRDNLDSRTSDAYHFAEKYKGCVPIVCVGPKYKKSLVQRQKAAFNENAKMVCFDVLPQDLEAYQNRIWEKIKDRSLKLLIMFDGEDLSKDCIKSALDKISKQGIPFELITLEGKTQEERIFRGILIIDYLTVFIAEDAKINPETTPIIAELKKRIRDN